MASEVGNCNNNGLDEDDRTLLKHDKHIQHDGTEICDEAIEFSTHDFDKRTWSRWSIEPFMFLFTFAYMTRFSCMTNLMLEKACFNFLNYSKEICENLSSYEKDKVEVERVANVYGQYATITTMGIGAIALVFIGPWSDRYGRKLPLLITLVGIILDDIGIILNTIYFEAPLGYLILPFVASGVTGGFMCVMFTVYSLVSELTREEQRTMKYAILQLAFGLGMSFGTLTGASLYMYFPMQTVFIVAAIGHVLTLPWILFVIPETRGMDGPHEIPWTKKLKDLFSPKALPDGFRAYVKLRPNNGRLQLWLFFISLCIFMLTYQAFDNMEYMFVFHMYSWSITKFSIVKTIFRSLGLILIVLCLPYLIRIFAIKDTSLGLVGSMSFAAKSLCTALATQPWIYYLGEACGLLNGTGILTIRSQVSKIVEKEELGKVFTFLAICETLVPVLGSIAMTSIFNSSITYFPGLCYLVTAILLLFPIMSFAWVTRLNPPITSTEIDSGDEQPIVT